VKWLKAGRNIGLKDIDGGTQQEGIEGQRRKDFLANALSEAQAEFASQKVEEPQDSCA